MLRDLWVVKERRDSNAETQRARRRARTKRFTLTRASQNESERQERWLVPFEMTVSFLI